MNLLKKIIFPLLSIFLAFRMIELMRILISTEPKEYGFGLTFFFAFLLTLYITGIFAFLGFAYPTNKVLPKSYYKLKNPKILVKISRILGVKYFQMLLMLAFWGTKKNRKKYFNGTKSGLKNFIFQTKQSEFGHFAALIGISILSIILIPRGYYSLVIIMTIINIIGNLYPILLQRLHRVRISKIMVDE